MNVEGRTKDSLDATEVEPTVEGDSWLLRSSLDSSLSLNPSLLSATDEKRVGETGDNRTEQSDESSKASSGG